MAIVEGAAAAAAGGGGRGNVRGQGKLHKGFYNVIHIIFHETATGTTRAVAVGIVVVVAKHRIILQSLLLALRFLGPSLPSGTVGRLFAIVVVVAIYFGVAHRVSDKRGTWYGHVHSVGRLRGHGSLLF